jgi:hypothetical protein
MTIAEIDAHPDADRIWATIAAMQKHVGDEIERREEEIREDSREFGRAEAANDCEYELRKGVDALLKDYADKISPELKTAIEELDCTP